MPGWGVKHNLREVKHLTFEDIINPDIYLWINKNSNYSFTVQIEDENCNLVSESHLTRDQLEAYARSCEQFLNTYENIKNI